MLNYPTYKVLLVLASLLAAASAHCDACVDGWCQTKKTLLTGLDSPSQMAIDRKNKELYLQTNSTVTLNILHEDFKIHLVHASCLAFDHDAGVLYTADENAGYKHVGNTTEPVFNDLKYFKNPVVMFYKDALYFKSNVYLSLFVASNEGNPFFTGLNDFKITDFVVNKNNDIYFVSNVSILYQFSGSYESTLPPKVVAKKAFVLSTDVKGDVYLGDATENVIYKMDSEENLFREYAVYKTGAIDKFVFDENNNIVFHDSKDGSINIWKSMNDDKIQCSVDAPHSKYTIKQFSKSRAIAQLEKFLETLPNDDNLEHRF